MNYAPEEQFVNRKPKKHFRRAPEERHKRLKLFRSSGALIPFMIHLLLTYYPAGARSSRYMPLMCNYVNKNQKNEPKADALGSFFTLSKSRYPFDFLEIRFSLFKKCITPFLGFFSHVSQACCFSCKDLLTHHPIVS